VDRSTFIALATLCAAAASAGMLSAAPITWTLTNINFDDGGTATGSFTWDADTNSMIDWSMSVTGGNPLTFPAFTYNPGDSSFNLLVGTTFNFQGPLDPVLNSSSNGYRDLRFNPNSALTDAGGIIGLNQGGFRSVECYNCNPFRHINEGGTVDATTAPEPATVALTALGLWGLFFVMQRRRMSS
jgi:hypothetical protein